MISSAFGRSRVAAFLVLLALVLIAARPAHAEVSLYCITGHITDTAGTPIPNALVSDGTRAAVADTEGRYRLRELTGGTYVLRTSAEGFASATRQVTVLVPGRTIVDFELTASSG